MDAIRLNHPLHAYALVQLFSFLVSKMSQSSLAIIARRTIAFAKTSSAFTESAADVFVTEPTKVSQRSAFDGRKVEHECSHFEEVNRQPLPNVISFR